MNDLTGFLKQASTDAIKRENEKRAMAIGWFLFNAVYFFLSAVGFMFVLQHFIEFTNFQCLLIFVCINWFIDFIRNG